MRVIEQHNLELAAEFFFKFARFEYALKASDYLKTNTTDAIANWRDLAERVTGIFDDPNPRLFVEALRYYSEHPPKKQMVENEKLVWREVKPETNLQADLILQYVRRVRNNLFHGGKFRGRLLANTDRTDELLKHGLVILERCIQEVAEVNEAYNAE